MAVFARQVLFLAGLFSRRNHRDGSRRSCPLGGCGGVALYPYGDMTTAPA